MLNVLVADNDDNIRVILFRYLENRNFNVIEADNSRDALNFELEKQLDMVILDKLMPEMDDYDVCRGIRKVSNLPLLC